MLLVIDASSMIGSYTERFTVPVDAGEYAVEPERGQARLDTRVGRPVRAADKGVEVGAADLRLEPLVAAPAADPDVAPVIDEQPVASGTAGGAHHGHAAESEFA
ncbi:hypothetical protein [Streptomyces sp. NPDC086010]|uniref:hypothetical protein n=1 Tax=Streptomyces sp. NPDC086010 TaxID=3365745 RepID=UPI0037CDC75A